MRKSQGLALIGVFALVAAACGGQDEGDSSATENLDDVTLVLDYFMDANKAPFIVGREKGFFEEQGINIDIQESGGGGEVETLVDSREAEFGTAYVKDFVLAVDNGYSLKMVANYQPVDQTVIFVREESTIQSIPDLEGKTLMIGADESGDLVEAVLQAGGADVNQVTIQVVDEEQRNAFFVRGLADAMVGPYEALAAMQEADPSLNVRAFPYSDYGFGVMYQGLYTHTALIEENPDLVRRMVDAAMNSYIYSVDHPEEILEIVPPLYPEASEEVLQGEMEIVFALLATENTSGHPFGYMAPEDWEDSLRALTAANQFSGDKAPEELYTNEFIGDWAPLEPQGEATAIFGG